MARYESRVTERTNRRTKKRTDGGRRRCSRVVACRGKSVDGREELERRRANGTCRVVARVTWRWPISARWTRVSMRQSSRRYRRERRQAVPSEALSVSRTCYPTSLKLRRASFASAARRRALDAAPSVASFLGRTMGPPTPRLRRASFASAMLRRRMVDPTRIELATPSMPLRCSAN